MGPGPTYDLVVRLRTIREELGLSLKDIMAMLEASPEVDVPPSESSLQRVFNGDLETISGFNYEATLRPLGDVLFPLIDKQDSALTKARIEGLMAEIDVQKQTIESLHRQISEAAKAQGERCKKCAEDIAFLKDQIALKDARMDKKDEWIDRLLGHIEEMLHSPIGKL